MTLQELAARAGIPVSMRYFVVIVPVGLSFGPMFMVMSGSVNSPFTIFPKICGLVGALGLSCGLVYIWLMLHSLKNELDELKKHGSNDAV